MHSQGDSLTGPTPKIRTRYINLAKVASLPNTQSTSSPHPYLEGAMSDRSYRPSYGEHKKQGSYYRDDSRDPRQRSISAGDEQSQKGWRAIDRYRPERSPNHSPTENTRRRNSSESIGGIDSERSGLKEIQDKQEKGYSRKPPLRPLSPWTARKTSATTEMQSTQQETNGLIIGNGISDPFICSLLDDGGRPCEQHFSGVRTEFSRH